MVCSKVYFIKALVLPYYVANIAARSYSVVTQCLLPWNVIRRCVAVRYDIMIMVD